jgi:hypothetical protein
MTAVQMMTGNGGWPLSVWLTPAGAELNKAPTNLCALLCVLDDLREHAHDHA